MDEDQSKIAGRHFLKNGHAAQISDEDLARGCEILIQEQSRTSLKAALNLARRFAKFTQGRGQPLRLTAMRALGRMSQMSGRHREALKAYSQARQLAVKLPLVRGRIDRALADVYLYLGDMANARVSAQKAIFTFKNLKSENDLAQARVNYANILHRQDRHRDAEKIYREAGIFFEAQNNQMALARCHYNRANSLLQLFDVDKAEELYQKAEKIYTDSGYLLDACDARYGLAWLWMLTGKFHQALLELSECEKKYRDGGDCRGEALCTLDRAEVFLGLGLYHDALVMASLAEQKFTKLGLRYEQTKAALFRAQAAFKTGKNQDAAVAVRRALLGFEKEKNQGFLGVSHLVASDLEPPRGESGGRYKHLTSARKLFSRAQLPLWEAICDLRFSYQGPFARQAIERLRRNRALQEVPHLSIAWQTRLGELEFSRGKISSARRHWETAAEKLDIIRAQLPPLDLRSAFARQQNSPHKKLIAINLEDDPLQAAVWSERFKTAGVWAPLIENAGGNPDESEIHQNLGMLAQQVAVMSQQIYEGSGKRSLAVSSQKAVFSKMRRRVRDSLLAYEPENTDYPISRGILASEFAALSKNIPIVQFHLQEKEIITFLHQESRVTTARISDGRTRLTEILRRWRFLLESELLAGYLTDIKNSATESSLWSELGEMLWKPLGLTGDYRQILIIPEGELSNIPWMALRVDGHYLSDRYNFVIAPSLMHYLKACNSFSSSERISFFHGISENIPHVAAELDALLKLTDGKASLFAPCSRNDLINAPEAAIWHYSGHAQFCSDNPFYSLLALNDGPLFAADLRAKKCLVNLVTLAGCRSGEQLALPGDEATGLVRSLMEMGARNIIAALWPLSDESSSFWMISFYNKLIDTNSILESARFASNKVREHFPSAYHWAAFSVFGAGNMGGEYEK